MVEAEARDPDRGGRSRVDSVASAHDRLDWPNAGLSSGARRVAFACLEALLCDEEEPFGALAAPDASICERAVASFDHSIGRGSSDLRRGFAVLAFAMEWLPLFIIGAPSRMSRLSLEQRVAYLEALEASRIGLLAMLFVAFKVPLCIAAFEEPELLAETGFDRPDTVARRSLPVLPARAVAAPPPELESAPEAPMQVSP